MLSSLLHKKAKEIAKIAEATFSNGLPVSCRFVNGWYCRTCGCLTEHKLVDGCQVCRVCDTPKSPIMPIQVLEHQSFDSILNYCSAEIEFEAVEKAVDSELRVDCNVSWYVMVRSQLFSNKKLEEVIKNAKF